MPQKSYEELDPSDVLDLEEKGDIEGLIAVLRQSRKRNVVKLAVNALGRLKDQKAVQPLIKWGLKSPLVSIRAAAIAALGDIGSDEAVKPLIQLMLKGMAVRAEAVEALGTLRATNAVNALVSVVEDEREAQQVREKALEALANVADKEAITSLVAALGCSLDEKASEVLRQVGKPAVMPLISALNGDKETIIWKAAEILGEIRDERAVEPLIALLLDESKDEWNRGHYVATSLGKIGDVGAVEPLIKLASRHTEDMLTCMSVRALGDIGNRRAVDHLVAILEDERTQDGLHSHLRLEVCWALGKLRDARAVESLARIAEGRSQEEPETREAAAAALIELDDDRIELSLLEYYRASSKDEVLKKLVSRLIRKTKGV